MGERIGLHQADDPLDLRSGVALVVDQETDQVLFSKNPDAVLPIASITKLMTAMVVTEAGQDLSEPIEISDSDVEAVRGNRSRLKVGTRMTRGELLHLALMASENRAAHALGRQYPGGLSAFVSAMNDMATNLGMSDTRYVEPTGLSSQNQSSARDLSASGQGGLPAAPDQAALDHAGGRIRCRLQAGPVPKHQRAGAPPGMGHRPAEDGVHLRSRPLCRHASRACRPQADHGAARLGRKVLAHRGRRAHPALAD
jgi:hypothetical protein